MWKTAIPTATRMQAICPASDPETGCGLVTDVCLKRKIRNYVETVKEDEAGYRIYVKDGVPLNRSDAEACAYLNVASDEKDAEKGEKRRSGAGSESSGIGCARTSLTFEPLAP